MPQPGMGVNPWDLPYPSGGGNNFPIPTYPGPSSFGQGRNYPPYMPSVAPATGVGGYPPYMNQGPGYPPTPGSGYNNFYNVWLVWPFDDTYLINIPILSDFSAKFAIKFWHNNRRAYQGISD